jgi:hypothetical protein
MNGESWFAVALPPPLPVANGFQLRFCCEKTAWFCDILRPSSAPSNTTLCLNPFSRRPLSLMLCTFAPKYGFEAPANSRCFIKPRLVSSSRSPRSTECSDNYSGYTSGLPALSRAFGIEPLDYGCVRHQCFQYSVRTTKERPDSLSICRN